MHDPDEGVSSTGTIVTGARRSRIPPGFDPIVAAAIEEFGRRTGAVPAASLHLYGSVATGCARLGSSDVDLLALGVSSEDAVEMSALLSERFGDRCRSVAVGRAGFDDLVGEGDEAYGNRVFLRHYCVLLAGADPVDRSIEFPADARAARGFNGDIAQHLERWRAELAEGRDPADLARRSARKSLLAVAGLVSVHDRTWTTDRVGAAARWGQVNPATTTDLHRLVGWTDDAQDATREQVHDTLEGPVAAIATAFEELIGRWSA